MSLGFPERSALVRRGAARLCVALGWAPLHEVSLPNGRRADILALRPDGGFVCIEVKSGERDFMVDAKWPEYRDFSDVLYFAVDTEFPEALIPEDVGLIVCHEMVGELVREGVPHPMAGARRKALMQRFAALAAWRLVGIEDPFVASLRAD